MILKVIINEHTYSVNIPDDMLIEGEDLFRKMDADMDKGWQMSRIWVDNPSSFQRCQIVADKMLTAIENRNQRTTMLMAAYILKRAPGVSTVDIDTTGDMTATEIIT